MKNLDLTTLCVEEMNEMELKETNGGSLLAAIVTVVVIVLAAVFATDNNPDTATYVNGERVGN